MSEALSCVTGRETTVEVTAAVWGHGINSTSLTVAVCGHGVDWVSLAGDRETVVDWGAVGCDIVIVGCETVINWGTGVCDTIVVGRVTTADPIAAVARPAITVCNRQMSAVALLDPCIAGQGSARRSSTGSWWIHGLTNNRGMAMSLNLVSSRSWCLTSLRSWARANRFMIRRFAHASRNLPLELLFQLSLQPSNFSLTTAQFPLSSLQIFCTPIIFCTLTRDFHLTRQNLRLALSNFFLSSLLDNHSSRVKRRSSRPLRYWSMSSNCQVLEYKDSCESDPRINDSSGQWRPSCRTPRSCSYGTLSR